MSASDATCSVDVLVIGAGPSGLAVGFELSQRNISFRIIEKGSTPANSWQAMPTHLKLLSPWKANRLRGSRGENLGPNAEISRAEYCSWLQHYAREHELAIVTGAEVSHVRRSQDGNFHMETSVGNFAGRFVINATGYFSKPFTPSIPGALETTIRQFHYAEYKDADLLRGVLGKKNPLVLLVGKRLSAGQTMVELVESGCTVALSHRGRVGFGSGPAGWWVLFRIHPWLEALKLKLQGPRARGVEIRMQGGKTRRWIQSGVVRTFPEIAAFERQTVVFRNGERLEPDAVVYATGFRPALGHLAALEVPLNEHTGLPEIQDMESRRVPGLFFLGLDGLRNFQSRFIRGIRNDAAVLANVLQERLRQVPASAKSIERPLAHVT